MSPLYQNVKKKFDATLVTFHIKPDPSQAKTESNPCYQLLNDFTENY